MRPRFAIRLALAAVLFGLPGLVVSPSAAQDSEAKPSSTKSTAAKKKKNKHSTSSKKGSKSHSAKKRGQKAIDSDRAREIQEALIKQHYRQGTASGPWDAPTEAALRKFQGDQGWQTKTVPDSRALIKLGLGPSKDGLLNPESAMTTAPDAKENSAANTKPQQ